MPSADDRPHVRHALIGVEHGRQGAAQAIPEDLALCVSCGWMQASDYAEHLAAEAFRAGYGHAQAEEEADRPLPVPHEYRLRASMTVEPEHDDAGPCCRGSAWGSDHDPDCFAR